MEPKGCLFNAHSKNLIFRFITIHVDRTKSLLRNFVRTSQTN